VDLNVPANAYGTGVGEVIEATKNTKLTIPDYPANSAFENIAAVENSTGDGYWLVHRCFDYFYAWEFTKDGLTSTDPVKSQIGDYQTGRQGQTKLSSDGTKIANTSGTRRITYGDFNAANGKVTNIKYRSLTDYSYIYSCEFSPNGDYLYFSSVDNLRGIYSIPTSNFMAGAVRFVTETAGTSIQTGPDKRIYTMNRNGLGGGTGRDVTIILDPDNGGYQVARVPDHLLGSSNIALTPRAGLPQFAASFVKLKIDDAKSCMAEELNFSVVFSEGYGNTRLEFLEWDFGDGSTPYKDSNWLSVIHKVSHTYAKPGKYIVKITPYLASTKEPLNDQTVEINVIIRPCAIPVNPNIHLYN